MQNPEYMIIIIIRGVKTCQIPHILLKSNSQSISHICQMHIYDCMYDIFLSIFSTHYYNLNSTIIEMFLFIEFMIFILFMQNSFKCFSSNFNIIDEQSILFYVDILLRNILNLLDIESSVSNEKNNTI